MEASDRRGGGSEPRGPALPGDLLCLALAHELKNDLQVLHGLFVLILDEPVRSPNIRRYARHGSGIATSASNRLRAVAGALLDGSGASTAQVQERVQRVVERAVETVVLRSPEDLGGPSLRVEGDWGEARTSQPFLLEIALVVLLDNAARATPRGGPPPVVVGESGGEGSWAVTVRDSGSGLPESARKVLTGAPGAYAEVDFSRSPGRWGLGLLLVRAASVAGGWRIELGEPEEGPRGTLITLRSPAVSSSSSL